MIIEQERNIFDVSETYALAHCVSEDCEMGAGIALEFEKRFNMKHVIRIRNSGINTCCMYGAVYEKNIRPIFNLITKKKYYQKPTYESLKLSLIDMKKQCMAHKIKLIAMPKIGCGLDKLKWEIVKTILINVFKDTDIEILVCYL